MTPDKIRLEALASQAAEHFGLGTVADAIPMGPSFNTVARLSTESGEWVMRASPAGWVDPSYEHRVRTHVARRSSLVTEPVKGRDGSTWFERYGSWVSVYPYVSGEVHPLRSAWRPRSEAAVLAELHRHLVGLEEGGSRPGYPPLRQQDWQQRSQDRAEKRVADLAARRVPITTPALEGLARLSDRLIAAFSFVRRWAGEAAAERFGPLSFAPIHGDYGPHNVVVADGSIVSVIDWDDCRPEWLGWEIARAAWQFAPDELSKGSVAQTTFVREYVAMGGPVSDTDLGTLNGMLRCVLVQLSIGSVLREPIDDTALHWIRSNLELFDSLPGS